MKINIRFIWFVFFRYISVAFWMGIIMSVMAYFLFIPEYRSITYSISFGFLISSFSSLFLFPLTFSAAPYYDCKNGKHWLFIDGDFGSEVLHCEKCSYKKPVVYIEYIVRRRLLDE